MMVFLRTTGYLIAVLTIALVVRDYSYAQNQQINYQGKITDTTGAAIADGDYDVTFALYTVASGGSAVWTETRTGGNQVTVTDGLFSVMLGEVTSLSGVDFTQTLYLGVNFDSDGEMTPRKVLGTVPAAFEALNAADADLLGGVASTSFLRADEADTATGLLTFSSGLISSASSTITELTTSTTTVTTLVVDGEAITTLTGPGLVNDSGTLTVNTSDFAGAFASTTDFDTSAELAAILGDETGTGLAVFNNAPTFLGTIDAVSADFSSTLTMSGSSANIALGSNFLSGDGDDEGIFVDASGNVGVGTSTPSSRLTIQGAAGSANTLTVASSTGATTLALLANGNLELPGQLISAGINWTARPAVGDNDDWNSVTYGNGLFVAVGDNGDRVMTSPDGITWTARSAAGDNDGWNSVTYGNGLFVAVGENGDRVMTSPDGITWTARSAAGDNDRWNSVTYGNGLFVAVGVEVFLTEDVVMTSADGITWTPRTPAGSNHRWLDVHYAKGLYVAVGGLGERVMTSSDGITWTRHPGIFNGTSWNSITYGNGLFVAAGQNGDSAMTSPDGITWSARSAAGNNDDWNSVTYGNGLFVAVGDNGDRVKTSGDLNKIRLATNNVRQGGFSLFGNAQIGTTTRGIIGTDAQLSIQTNGTADILNLFETGGDEVFTVLENGNVGIGTSTPSQTLTIAGDAYITSALYDSTNTAGTAGMVLQTTGSGTQWVATSTLGFGTGNGDFLADGSVDMTDTLFLAQGALGTGGISFAGDTDTGILRASADNIQIEAGGTIAANFTDTDISFLNGNASVQNGAFTANIFRSNFSGATSASNVGFGSSNSTGMFGPATNQLAFSTNNTERLRIDASGNVGIGTTSPQSLLHVLSESGNTARGILVENTVDGSTASAELVLSGGDDVPRLTLRDFAASVTSDNVINGISNSQSSVMYSGRDILVGGRNIYFGTNANASGLNSASVMSLLSSGEVTIGTTTAYSNLTIQPNSNEGISILEADGGNEAIVLRAGNAGGNIDLYRANGNLNISLLESGAVFNESGGSNVDFRIESVGEPDMFFVDGAETAVGVGYGATDLVGTTGSLLINGNVGIGTTTPGEALAVAGDVAIREGDLTLINAQGETAGFNFATNRLQLSLSEELVVDHGAGDIFSLGLYLADTVSVTNTGLLIGGERFFGVNDQTPDARVEIAQTVGSTTDLFYISSSDGGNGDIFRVNGSGQIAMGNDFSPDFGLELLSTSTDGYFGISSAASNDGDVFVVNSAGNVGIGTNIPSQLLTVAGNAYITGALFDSTNASGTDGMVLQSTGVGTQWVATSSLGFASSGDLASYLPLDGSSDMTDTLFLAQGALGTGGISFAGDADTGIFSTTSDRLSVSAGGIEHMVFNGSGLIGIGETNPIGLLHIEETGLSENEIVIGSFAASSICSTGTSNVSICLANNNFDSLIRLGSSAVDYVEFIWDQSLSAAVIQTHTNDVLALQPTANRNVGIGTTTPSQKLTLEGNAYITGALFDSTNASGTDGMVLQSTGSGTQWVATSTLGFGTGDGDFLADGSVDMTDTLFLAQGVLGTGGISFAGDSDTGMFRSAANQISFFTAGTQALRIDSGGKVNLNEVGDTTTPALGWTSDTDTGFAKPLADELAFITGGASRLYIDDAGNVGIGTTTPSQKLTLEGNAYITGALFDSTNSAGTTGMVLQTTGTGTQWVATSSLGIGGGSIAPDSLNFTDFSDTLSIDANTTISAAAGSLTIGDATNGISISDPSYTLNSNGLVMTSGYGSFADNRASNYVGLFLNDGNNANRQGVLIQAGLDNFATAGPSTLLQFNDGDGTDVGSIEFGGSDLRINAGSGGIRIADDIFTGDVRIATNGASNIRVGNISSSAYIDGSTIEIDADFGLNLTSPDFSITEANGVRSTNGTAGAPSLSFLDDTDLGMFRAAADQIGFSTAGTERLRIDASGYVGIGTNSPDGIFHVLHTGSGAEGPILEREVNFNSSVRGLNLLARHTGNMDNDFGSSFTFSIQDNAGVENAIGSITAFRDGADDSGALAFRPASAGTTFEAMRIDSSGNVGIGTSTPGALLSVDGGAVHITNAGNSGAASRLLELRNTNNTANAYAQLVISAGTTLNAVELGHYASGATSPTHLGIAAANYVWFEADTTTNGMMINTEGSDPILFGTNDAERMRISSNGNIGIGTNSPGYTLDVAGDINFASDALLRTGGEALLSASTTGFNVALGINEFNDMHSGVTGAYNTFVGTNAGANVTSGSNNVLLGRSAGFDLTTEGNNTYIGSESGLGATTGTYNTGLGRGALRDSAADFTIAIGASAGRDGDGSGNILIGTDAGRNSDGGQNIMIGDGTGSVSSSGSRNILIGENIELPTAATNDFLSIGNLIYGDLSTDRIGIGDSTPAVALQVSGDIRVGTSGSNGCLEDFGGTSIAGTCSSDLDLKTDIMPITSSSTESYMERFAELEIVTYRWNQAANTLYSKNTDIENLGVIAQDVEALFPELVSRDDEGYRQVDFRAFPFYIIEALKEVWAVISGHSERIAELEEENAALLERLEAVEAELQIDKASTVSPSAASTEIADDINTNADGDTEIATITEDVADVSAASTAASSTNSDENELTDDTENVAVEETTQSAEAADGDEATVAESVSGDHEEAATSSDASVALTESEGDTAEATEAPEDATVAEPDEVSSEVTI